MSRTLGSSIRRRLVDSLFGMVILVKETCLNGHHGGAYGGAYFAVVLAWRKGVASAQRSGLTSEEVGFFGFVWRF